MVLIDHQVGLADWIRDQSPMEFKNAVLGLAGTAKTLGIPTIRPRAATLGPTLRSSPSYRAMFPEVPVLRRTGTINAYPWPEFRAALEASGRKRVIIAGVSSTTCLSSR